MNPNPPSPLLTVSDLTVEFDTDEGPITAADRVSFEIRRGEVLGLVGESGCGKTVTAMSILRLIPSPPGRISRGRVQFDGRDLVALPIAELRGVRGRRISMIFQEPMTALSPLQKIGRQMTETIRVHQTIGPAEAQATGRDWLANVGIPDPDRILEQYPFQLSGGMRQRVMIAMALMLRPDLVIADEPTTALDVTIQAQVFDLIRTRKGEDTSLLLITHDMGAIWDMCDRVVVMYASQVVEEGPLRPLFERPLHPYTEGLLQAMPQFAPRGGRLPSIPGQVPSPRNYPAGCHFAERCPFAYARCRAEKPGLAEREGRRARCFLVEEGKR